MEEGYVEIGYLGVGDIILRTVVSRLVILVSLIQWDHSVIFRT